MEVLLLTDIRGVGKKNDLLTVKSGYALNFLLPQRFAIVATPKVRQQYAELIRKRAEERQQEKALQESLVSALGGKVVKINAKVSKGGKLYAAISPEKIAEYLKEQYSVDLPAHAITTTEPVKTVGTHTVTVHLGAETTPLTLEVKAEEEKK